MKIMVDDHNLVQFCSKSEIGNGKVQRRKEKDRGSENEVKHQRNDFKQRGEKKNKINT